MWSLWDLWEFGDGATAEGPTASHAYTEPGTSLVAVASEDDPSYPGMSIFACDAAEAAPLWDRDPSVVAGRLAYDVME